MLYKTQGQIEREYDGKFFRENSLEKVLETFKNANVKDNVSFVNFVNDNIVSKTISPHNAIKPIKREKAQQINRPLQKKILKMGKMKTNKLRINKKDWTTSNIVLKMTP